MNILLTGVCLLQLIPSVCCINEIVRNQLITHYFHLGYKYSEIIGFMFCVHGISLSLRNLKRILRKLGLQRNNVEFPLFEIIKAICFLHQEGYINLGYRAMWKLLNVMCNVRTTQNTVRSVLKVISPNAVALRSRHRLQRRVYYNKGPNFLIHIDGYDKLKPFGIAINGAIDGYSRKILWLEASNTNNNPRVVARYFINYIRKLKRVPRVVRSDHGSENSIIKDIQTFLRKDHTDVMHGEKSFQYGPSTSNQRIEMLWSFLMKNFTQFWRNLFKDLRDAGLLNTALQVNCLRFSFMPLIRHRLEIFKNLWNSHRIRSQRNSEVPCGIPDVLYNQAIMFGDTDYSFSVPYSSEDLNILSQLCTEAPAERGCPDNFWYEFEHQCNLNRDECKRLVPDNVDDALLLFKTLLSIL